MDELPESAVVAGKPSIGGKSYSLADPNETSASKIQVLLAGRAFYITNVDPDMFKMLQAADKTEILKDRVLNNQNALQISWGDTVELVFEISKMVAGWS